jgi:hypothetical protein
MRRWLNRKLYDMGFSVPVMSGVDYPKHPLNNHAVFTDRIGRKLFDVWQNEQWQIFVRNNFINVDV